MAKFEQGKSIPLIGKSIYLSRKCIFLFKSELKEIDLPKMEIDFHALKLENFLS
jgi:hypothetical protein